MAARYGAALLTGGYTALPTYAWVYYARLGVTEAEMVLLAQLCAYWWDGGRDPYPSEAALAQRMGKTVRTIQGYLRSLTGKGLLHIHTQFSPQGQQSTNAYDLRPFFAAVEGLARLDGLLPAPPADAAPPATSGSGSCHPPRSTGDNDLCNVGPCDAHKAAGQGAERGPLCADAGRVGTENRSTDHTTAAAEGGEGSPPRGAKNPAPQVNPIEKDYFDVDSMPPTPADARFRTETGVSDREERPQLLGEAGVGDPDHRALVAEIAALGAELGDDAPASSVTRANNLRRDAGVPLGHFLRTLDEAAARTRARQASIVTRRRVDARAVNGMPYLFAVLADLLHPAPLRTPDVGPPPDRRRRRRDGGRGAGEPVGSSAVWYGYGSPAPLPLTEAHPVWRAVLAELAQVLTSENYNAWLATTRALDQAGDVLRVAVPAPFNGEWLARKLAGKVAHALRKIDYDALGAGRVGRVEYVVDAAACAPAETTERAS